MRKTIYIVGSKGIPAKYGGFETFVEKLTEFKKDKEIQYYVDKYQPMDKAGAYGVQEWIGYIGVKSISGSFYNIMGLPIQKLYGELKKL